MPESAVGPIKARPESPRATSHAHRGHRRKVLDSCVGDDLRQGALHAEERARVGNSTPVETEPSGFEQMNGSLRRNRLEKYCVSPLGSSETR